MPFDTEFRDHLVHEKNDFSFISSSCAEERFQIYKNTMQVNLKNCLLSTFPLTAKLLGESFFKTVAQAYCLQKQYWPTSGNLDEFGEQFPVFLSKIKQLDEYPYCHDFAQYEWMRQQSYLESNSLALQPESLSKLTLEECDNLTFKRRPTTVLLSSPYNLAFLEKQVQGQEEQKEELVKKSYGIITRLGTQRATLWIDQELYHFIEQLDRGQSISKAEENIENLNLELNLTQALAFIFKAQIFKDFSNHLKPQTSKM